MSTLHTMMLGALVATCVFATVLFLRFWRRSRDRFHLFLSLSFALLGANWIVVASIRPSGEPHSEIYLIRLAAFLIILFAIVDKNRRAS